MFCIVQNCGHADKNAVQNRTNANDSQRLAKCAIELKKCLAYHVSHQFWMNFTAEQVPPCIQVAGQMFVFLWWIWFFGHWIKVDHPWFQLTDEMKDFHIFAESTHRKTNNSILHTIPK